ncbi:hypothetical protein [Nigerium massiliense]|uniref:hypothetical protein n=1 Tax=Nigerium massiliense TaxID=1522317 RepID=UPI00059084FF|nr:hypothetical protein [Nigerium massiliense]
MVENVKRFREPAAWIVLAIVVAGMVLSAVRLANALTREHVPASEAFQDAANSGLNLTALVLLVAAVCVCHYVGTPSPNARRLALWSAVTVTVGVVLTIIATGAGLSASAGTLGVVLEALGGLLSIVLKALAAAVLWIVYRASGRPRVEAEPPAAIEGAAEPEEDEQRPAAVWRPSEASGSVWTTAAQAASGTAPSAMGTAHAGWHAASAEPADPAEAEPSGLWAQGSDENQDAAARQEDLSSPPRLRPTAGRQGAAEAIGWRRATPEDGDTPTNLDKS